jgi:hypothetical protein
VPRIVTARYFRDPPPWRAGRAPDCEDSLRAQASDEAYRLMGKEPPTAGYALLDLDTVRDRAERLAPRRWTPPELRKERA